VAVMPCYDKKLEASRQDFYNDIFRTRDVDCVITTGELEKVLQEKQANFQTLMETPLDSPFVIFLKKEERKRKKQGNPSPISLLCSAFQK
jgi:iron only hydrogenase large subunit-like protein